jgi:xanthine dehydrogenase YagS FAD-binding subunit
VSAAAVVELDGVVLGRVRLALGSVAHRPWRLTASEAALAGIAVDDRPALRAALERSFGDARPLAYNGHKVLLAKAAALRALELAARLR